MYIMYNNYLKATKHILNARDKYLDFSSTSLNRQDLNISLYNI